MHRMIMPLRKGSLAILIQLCEVPSRKGPIVCSFVFQFSVVKFYHTMLGHDRSEKYY